MKAAPCTRPISEQFADRSGAVRRGDHRGLRRLDLLDDADLDSYRRLFGSDALDAHELLLEAMEARLEQSERAARRALEDRIEARPLLAVGVCVSCGAFEIVRTSRPWAIDRAMRRSGLAERDVRAAHRLLVEAGGDDDLDHLSAERLRELRGLVDQDVDLDTVRARFARSARAS